MEKEFAEIINEGKKNGKTIEAINKELKEAGATFHLDYTMTPDGPQTGWSKKEMAEGFQPGEPAKDAVHLHDIMRYNPANAGKTIRVSVVEGTYDVTWNENGNPVKAVKK